jgi:hypothetical protein
MEELSNNQEKKYIIKYIKISEYIEQNKIYLFYYGFLLINYLINCYLINYLNDISNLINDKDDICSLFYTRLYNKINYYNYIDKYSLFIFIIIFFSRKYLPIYTKDIFIIIYILAFFLKMDDGDIFYYYRNSKLDIPINKCKLSFINILAFYYIINIMLSFTIIFFFVLILIIIISIILDLIQLCYNYWCKKYVNAILNHQIEYIEEQFDTPEKII